jgi:hypothetical protein
MQERRKKEHSCGFEVTREVVTGGEPIKAGRTQDACICTRLRDTCKNRVRIARCRSTFPETPSHEGSEDDHNKQHWQEVLTLSRALRYSTSTTEKSRLYRPAVIRKLLSAFSLGGMGKGIRNCVLCLFELNVKSCFKTTERIQSKKAPTYRFMWFLFNTRERKKAHTQQHNDT